MKKPHGKLFVIFNNTDSWLAAFPVLKGLEAMGHSVTVLSTPSAPSHQHIANSGFSTIMVENFTRWNDPKALVEMDFLLWRYEPDCVLVGVADTPGSSEKTALNIARIANIPTVALIQSLPHGWLGVHGEGEGDFPIYQVVNTTCVMDHLSKSLLISHGWPSELVVVIGNLFCDLMGASLNYIDAAREPVADATSNL